MQTATLGLEFRVANKHFRQGDMKLKCLATIATVYLQSNEESVEGDESVLKTPMMESRGETRAQSHIRDDLANGKLRARATLIFLLCLSTWLPACIPACIPAYHNCATCRP